MLCVLTALAFLSGTESARILGIFPMPSISHQVVFNVYMQELVKRGHEVVVVTPNPTNPRNNTANLTEIDIRHSYRELDSVWKTLLPKAKRGVVTNSETMFEVEVFQKMVNMFADIFKNHQLQSIAEDKNQHFDLIILEAMLNYHLIASKIFNAPVILFSSLYGTLESFDIIGAVSRHPVLYPNVFRNKFRDLTTWEIIKECYTEYTIMKNMADVEMFENELLKQNYGHDAPTIQELKNNVVMLFLNSHPLFADNRPVPPGVVYLGALHLKPVKELPQVMYFFESGASYKHLYPEYTNCRLFQNLQNFNNDLKTYLDNSKRGVVYVSLGSNVRPENMDKDMLETFLSTFEALPYDVLWKYAASLDKMPKNLRIEKWFPQRDLLTHPNIKVFVTQGGLQSTDEAIDAGVPLVGIPMMADQWFNTNKYVQLGIGEQLDPLTLTANDLTSAIKTVIKDLRFRDNIKRLKEIMNDQPQRPLERAMWWTEHVLRHGDARHLRAPAANMSWTQYLMLDIMIPVLLVFLTFIISIIIVTYIAIKSLISRLTGSSKVKKS